MSEGTKKQARTRTGIRQGRPGRPPKDKVEKLKETVGSLGRTAHWRADAVLGAKDAPLAANVNVNYEKQLLQQQKKLLEEVYTSEVRDLASKSFWFFVTEVLFPGIWMRHYTDTFHKPLCDDIQSTQRGENKLYILPRASRKSFLLDIAHCIWRIVQDPNIRILLIGAREDTVLPFARIIRSAFVAGTPGFQTFHDFYPEFVIKDRKHLLQAAQFTHPLRTVALPDPTFRATYLGVTGAGWRCDMAVFDDCVERRNVTSPEMAVETLRKIMDLFPLVDNYSSEYANIFMLGTMWAYFDPYNAILGRKDSPELSEVRENVNKLAFKATVRHALESPTKTCTACPPDIVKAHPHGHPSMDDDAKPILFPIVDRAAIDEIFARYQVDENLGESEFWHQHMNVCLSPAQQKFEPAWFDILASFPRWQVPRRKLLCLDDASKDMQKVGIGDYSVALMGEFDDVGRLLLVYGLRDNQRAWTREEFIRRILSWCQASSWWPEVIVKEKTATDNFLPDIQKKFNDVYRPVAVSTVTRGRKGKEDWIVGAIQGPAERGEIIFAKGFPDDLRLRVRAEATSLGQVAHEDAIDALSLFFAEGIRLVGSNRMESRQEWTPPELNLFDPDKQRPIYATPQSQEVVETTFGLLPSEVKIKDESSNDWW